VRVTAAASCIARLLACSLTALALPVTAFTLSDGTSLQCVARGVTVPEEDVSPASADFTGRAVSAGPGYRILWNRARLDSLPPVMRDFLFFHECAHAQLRSPEELAANCAGLKAMRAAGRAGFTVESKIAAFYSPGNAYWTRTLACANASAEGEPESSSNTPR